MRNFNLDIVRCIAIIFVICIHSMGKLNECVETSALELNYIVYLLLSSVIYMGVPLFVMLSGALLLGKNEEPLFFLRKRFKRILIPFFIWSIIVYCLDKITSHQSQTVIQSTTEFSVKFLTNGVHGIYWYIYMLTGLYLLTPILQKIFKDISLPLRNYSIVLITLLIVVQHITPPHYRDESLIFKYLFPYLIYLGYYIGGYYIYTYAYKSVYFRRITICGFLIFSCGGIINQVKPFSTFPVYFFQSLFFFGILISMRKKTSTNKKQNLITFISNTSYGIYLSHFLFISALCKAGFEQMVPAYMVPLLMVFIVLCLEIGLQYGIKRFKLGKLLQ